MSTLPDLYGDPIHIHRWDIGPDGVEGCFLDGLPLNDASATAVLQKNAAVRAMVEAVTAYETALRVPAHEEGADTTDYDAAQAVIADASDVTKALASLRAGDEADTAAIDEEIDRLASLPLVVDPRPVPVAVSPLQWRKALRVLGLKPAIDAFIAAADDETREAYEYAVEYRRDDPTLNTAAELLGKSSAELDDLFRHASAL